MNHVKKLTFPKGTSKKIHRRSSIQNLFMASCNRRNHRKIGN